MLTSASSPNKLILPRIKSEMRGCALSFSDTKNEPAKAHEYDMPQGCVASKQITDDRNCEGYLGGYRQLRQLDWQGCSSSGDIEGCYADAGKAHKHADGERSNAARCPIAFLNAGNANNPSVWL